MDTESKTSNLEKEEFLIANNFIFSKKEKEIEIIKNIPEIEILDSKLIKNNKYIIEKIDEIIKNKTKITIFEDIKNFNMIKNKIENKFKNEKSKFEKIDSNDYLFIEKTSQIEILNQILNNLENNPNFFILEKKINNYCEENEDKEEKLENELFNKKENIEINIEGIKKELKEINEEIKLKENENENFKNKNSQLNKEKTNIENFLKDNKKQKRIRLEIELLEQKIKKLDFKIEGNKLDIKLIKTKISNINSEISIGKKKKINLILFILTLGLIYWTKYSNIKYQKNILQNKINKKEEKELEIEKEKHKLKEEINEIKFNEKQLLKKQKKKNEEMIKNIKEIKIKLKNNEKEIFKINKNLENKLNEKEKINKKIEINQEELNKIKEEKEELKKNSIRNILKILEDILEQRNENIELIKNIIKKLENQKTSISGSYKVKL